MIATATLVLALGGAPAAIVTDMTPALLEQALQEGRVKAKSGLLGGLFGKTFPRPIPAGRPQEVLLPDDAVQPRGVRLPPGLQQNRALRRARGRGPARPELWVVCSPITRSREGSLGRTPIALVAGDRAVPALATEVSRELYQDRFGVRPVPPWA